MKLLANLSCYLIFFCSILVLVVSEYANEDEPRCRLALFSIYKNQIYLIINLNLNRDDCFSSQITEQEKNNCLKTYMEFYSYKLVRSMFNFAKTSVYAGLWVNRYVNDIKISSTILTLISII